MNDENEYLDDYEDEYDYGEQTDPPRPYTPEQLAEREEWTRLMRELAPLVCFPGISED